MLDELVCFIVAICCGVINYHQRLGDEAKTFDEVLLDIVVDYCEF